MNFHYSNLILGFAIGAAVTMYSQRNNLLPIIKPATKKQQKSHAVEESLFVMSTTEQCHRANQYRDRTVAKCPSEYCRAKIAKRIIEHIDGAKHLLCVCLYQISLDFLAEALLRAQRRGVIVRFITDKTMINSSNSQINKLERAGKHIVHIVNTFVFDGNANYANNNMVFVYFDRCWCTYRWRWWKIDA